MDRIKPIVRTAWPWAREWGALVLAAGSLVLGIASVGNIPWQWLVYSFGTIFIVQLLYANRRLSSVQGKEDARRAFIAELTHLSSESVRLSEHPGKIGSWFMAGGPPSALEIKMERQQKEYASLSVEWGQRVRGKLESGASEFIADWEAAKPDERYELLRNIIQELRRKL